MTIMPEEPTEEMIRALFTLNSATPRTTEEVQSVYQALINFAALSTRPAQEPVAGKIRNNPAEYVTIGMIQDRNRKEWLAELSAKHALQAIADLPTGDNLDVMQGQEEAYRAVERLFTSPPHIEANPSAALQPVLSQPEVKALTWREWTGSQRGWQADSALGQYQVCWLGEYECWQCSRPQMAGRMRGDDFSRHEKRDEAKAAAQQDYEQRILSALCPLSDIPAQAGETVTDNRHEFVPNKKYPWFCAHCGYAPHEPLMHVQPAATASEGSTDVN